MKQPNILFIMSDDHAAHAISCYGSKINQTPNLDRIANEGMRFDNCFCTNSICAPSRAVILTGKHSHLNGVETLADNLDGRQVTVPKLLKNAGYQTAIIGKWHLGHGGDYDPTGFDYWNVLIDQGFYHNPVMIEMGEEKRYEGYATDLIADFSIDWLKNRDKDRPFMLMCHHKAPHREWEPDEKHQHMYENENIPLPPTLYDDYSNRSNAAKEARMRIDRDFRYMDLKLVPPEGSQPNDYMPMPKSLENYTLTPEETGQPVSFKSMEELVAFKYQRYIKDYLRCIASVDDNVGRLLDYLDEEGIAEDTIVIYTSDQGFFLGDHGWYDKRFMYEESLRMPFMIKYPKVIQKQSVCDKMILNLDFAETFLDFAGVDIPKDMQGVSIRPLLEGKIPENWRTSMYYRYWQHLAGMHYVGAHYGIRTDRYKLIYYYGHSADVSWALDETKEPEWELFDLEKDPHEINNVYNHPDYKEIGEDLKGELYRLKAEAMDTK